MNIKEHNVKSKAYLVINPKSAIPVIITATHAQPPNSDKHTGEITESIAVETGATALIAKVSRIYMDFNRLDLKDDPFKKKLKKIIEMKRKPVLILDIHGKKYGKVELGTANGTTATQDVIGSVKNTMESNGMEVTIDEKFRASHNGTIIKSFGSPNDGINAIQIEFPPELRSKDKFKYTVKVMSSVISNVLMVLKIEK